MKLKVWALCTCIPGDTEPITPRLFTSEKEVREEFDRVMRDEWLAYGPHSDDDRKWKLPYPGDPDDAQRVIVENGGEILGRWRITTNFLEFDLPAMMRAVTEGET